MGWDVLTPGLREDVYVFKRVGGEPQLWSWTRAGLGQMFGDYALTFRARMGEFSGGPVVRTPCFHC